MKYRKLPVTIEAHQWHKNGDHPEDGPANEEGKVVRFYRHPEFKGSLLCHECNNNLHFHGFIDTKEGGHRVCPGDWIITGVKGERYPCKPDIFALTYTESTEIDSAREYQSKVLRTENTDFKVIRDRALAPAVARELKFHLQQAIEVASRIDMLKKHIFYGKPLMESHVYLVSPEEHAQYQRAVIQSDINLGSLHGILGILSEAGELGYLLKRLLYECGTGIECPELCKELGDVTWFVAQCGAHNGLPLALIFTQNIEKLRRRYPEKFTEEQARNHDSH